MKFELNKTWLPPLFWAGVFFAIPIFASLFIFLMYRLNDFWLLSWIIPGGTGGQPPTTTSNNSAESIRNFAWVFWMLLSLYGATLGLWLAWRGRQTQRDQWKTQHESHLQERYEKAADMLSSELEATRIAACLSLVDLGETEESMKSRCVQLLFAFISEPYLEKHEVEIYIRLKGRKKDEYLSDLFPANEPLRPDIQQATASFSKIYSRYSGIGIDKKQIKLPPYFWKNEKKGKIFLARASLWDADLRNAYLQDANFAEVDLQGAKLQGADLRNANLKEADLLGAKLQRADLQGAELRGAKLQEANLQGADLENADISLVDMREIYNLTKKHVLSAKWGYDAHGYGGSPQLPADLVQDNVIKEWLNKAFYGEKKKSKISQLYYLCKKSLSLMLSPFDRIFYRLLTLLVSSKFHLQVQEMQKNQYIINNADNINIQYMGYDENLQKQFEKTIDMLNSDNEWVRIGACRSLVNLGKFDESMKSQCVRLLFAFINNPYLEAADKGKNLDELFPADEPLRTDISEAISSFSDIYRHYFMDGVDDGRIVLPNYFWANKYKGTFSLLKANLRRVNLQGANLSGANLRRTNFQEADLHDIDLQRANLLVANLRGANLSGANLQDANLSMASLLEIDLQDANLQNANLRKARLKGANLARADLRRANISAARLQEAENLSKEQILLAQWGYAKYGSRHQPELPVALMQDEDIKEWLETPTYDDRKPNNPLPIAFYSNS